MSGQSFPQKSIESLGGKDCPHFLGGGGRGGGARRSDRSEQSWQQAASYHRATRASLLLWKDFPQILSYYMYQELFTL